MNIINDYEEQLEGVSGTFSDLPIKSTVQKELDFWNDLTEEKEQAFPKLKSYWDYIGVQEWSPTGTPWSSAFISFVLKDQGFPKQSAHRNYIKEIIDKNGAWKAFSIPKTQNLKLEVGNVLIKPRSGNYNNSHGDVVYMIKDGFAYLVGGNISNTAKVTKIIEVDKDGFVKKRIPNYLVILKKKDFKKKFIIPVLSLAVIVFATRLIK